MNPLNEMLSQKGGIRWETRNTWKQSLPNLPTVGGGFPKGKIREYRGYFADGTVIKVSKTSLIFFSLATWLNLSPSYKGPWEWICIQIGEFPNKKLCFADTNNKDYQKMNELFKSARSKI